MPSYQYYVYVLARDASRYRHWKVLDSVRPPLAMPLIVTDDQDYYRVLTPRAEAPLALPTRSLAWTSTAYVVWDDVLPAVLNASQQQAMLDWLHWGGGLIISGPRTLDQMRGTFLEPYLPAVAAETAEIDEASLAELNSHWTLPAEHGASVPLVPTEPWTGIKFQKHPAAEFLPSTGELVVERRGGRGRIVATAFRLTERELLAWRSYDSFVNSCLLGRPRRRFEPMQHAFAFVRGAGHIAENYPDAFEPELITAVRYFTRDTQEPKDGPTSRSAFQQELVAAGADPDTLASLRDSYAFAEQDRLESLKGAAARPAGMTLAPSPGRPARRCARRPASRCPIAASCSGWWACTW